MSSFARAEIQADAETFHRQIKPLLQKYCGRCHGAKTSKARIRFDNIDPDIIAGEHFGKWEDVREAFNNGEMPPDDERQPTAAERDLIAGWLDTEFKKAKQYGNPKKRGSVRRLTRYELRYALEDLLRVSAKEEVNALPEEATSLKTGLKNSSRLLMISGPHLESYLNVIISVINKMKEIAVFEPDSARVDIANLDTSPPVTFADKGRPNKPPVSKVERTGKGVTIQQRGYIDLKIPAIPRYIFQTTLAAKADGPGNVEISIGFQHSNVDPRQKVFSLGNLLIEKSDEVQRYTLSAHPDLLPKEMSRALDRQFFIRISNRNAASLYLEAIDYAGNVNSDLTASLIPTDIAEADLDNHIHHSISSFIEKAFRRSPTAAEIEKYNGVYRRSAEIETPIIALLSTYQEILCSPGFFYLGLPGDLSEEQKTNYKLAERLAFCLWCSVPDEDLLNAASSSELMKPDVLASHVQRMLRDEKSRRWVENFADQWLQTSRLFNVAVDSTYYPKFRDSVKELMRQETIEAVNDVLRNGASALDLLQADHVFVNQSLAGFYQLERVRGDHFRKVAVEKESHRGGLLTQATFLVGNSDGMNSHAILRGVWLADVILNDPPPDPPKNVPPLDESIPGFDRMTLNEKLFAHRDNAACRSCHQKIDPWGIPLENYDASGVWREQVLIVSKAAPSKVAPSKAAGKRKNRKRPVFEKSYVDINRKSTLPDGATIDGVEKLKEYLVTHRQRDFAKGLTERILAYALSRDIDYHDEDFVNRLVDHFEDNNYSVPALILEITQSESFRRGY